MWRNKNFTWCNRSFTWRSILLHVTQQKLHVTQQKLHVTQQKLHVTQQKLHVTQQKLHVTQQKLHVTQQKLHVTQQKLHVTQQNLMRRDKNFLFTYCMRPKCFMREFPRSAAGRLGSGERSGGATSPCRRLGRVRKRGWVQGVGEAEEQKDTLPRPSARLQVSGITWPWPWNNLKLRHRRLHRIHQQSHHTDSWFAVRKLALLPPVAVGWAVRAHIR